MVYFYQSQPDEFCRSYQVVAGKDKFENDLLIKWGYRELDYMWFHTDKYSSGHIYLKFFADEKSINCVPSQVINDCLQLCKSESIQGNKMAQCTIIYTPWHNLRKNRHMKPGEVSFKSLKKCGKKECYVRDQKVINRLVRTRVELIDGLEELLNLAKKSKDGNFFVKYIAENREKLLEEEKERKRIKKRLKKQSTAKETAEEDQDVKTGL